MQSRLVRAKARTESGAMIKTVKVRSIGSSTGIVLPKELLARLHIKPGDTLYVIETQGGLQLTRLGSGLDKSIEAARRIMRKCSSTLRKLAE
jgi:putative addiction module antidote